MEGIVAHGKVLGPGECEPSIDGKGQRGLGCRKPSKVKNAFMKTGGPARGVIAQ